MTEHWTFEGGRIVARNEAGALLLALSVDQGIHGPLLAAFIDGTPALGRLLLSGFGYGVKPA